MLGSTLGSPNFGLISVKAKISGLATEILVLSSSNLLDKESALVYQHFRDLKAVTTGLDLSCLGTKKD